MQWGLIDDFGIQAESAWEITTGNSNIRVGIIDSGVADHPDLNANLVTGWDFVNDNAITNDDPTGHGTHIAGIIGATGSNVNGITGVCRDVQLVPLQVIRSDNTIDSAACVSAITWSALHNIHILNYSMGAYGENTAISTAIGNTQALFVCSAGNDNNNNDIIRHYISDYSQAQSFSNRVISVGSIDETGAKSYFSNYGTSTVSLFAPGDEILSTVPYTINNSGYANKSGTSMATPFVTGTAALMMSLYEDIPQTMTLSEKAIEIKNGILNNVSKVYTDNPLSGLCVSEGYLNAHNALRFFGYKKRVFEDFGYTGTTYYWKGIVDMEVPCTSTSSMNGNTLSFNDYEDITFKLKTKSCHNALTSITGTVSFQLKNSAGTIYQIEDNDTFVSTVNVTSANNVAITNAVFLSVRFFCQTIHIR